MGLVKFGGGVAAISGKIGGTVYGRNKSGSVARNWAKPTNPGSPAQSAARARFGNRSNAWNGLSEAEVDSWNGAATTLSRLNRLGESYVPTGRQYFLELNNNLSVIGATNITTPPVDPTPPDMDQVFTIDVMETANVLDDITITGLTVAAGTALVVEAAPITPLQKKNLNNELRVISVVPAGAGPFSIETNYINQFGDSAPLDWYYQMRLSVVSTTTGLRSTKLLTSSIVGAT